MRRNDWVASVALFAAACGMVAIGILSQPPDTSRCDGGGVIGEVTHTVAGQAVQVEGWACRTALVTVRLSAVESDAEYGSRVDDRRVEPGRWSMLIGWSHGQPSPRVHVEARELLPLKPRSTAQLGLSGHL